MVTSASPLQRAARETRDALDEVARHNQLLAASWRRQLQAVRGTVEQLLDGQGEPGTLRSASEGGAVMTGHAVRYQDRFADEVVTVMRAYADRIEQVLLELSDAAHAAVGAPAGGLLPTRGSHVPPRPDLDRISVGDAARLPDERSAAVRRSIELFADRLAGQVEEAIDTLRARLGEALECRARGEQVARDRADELARTAQQLAQFAHGLDWMFFDAR